MLSLRTQCMTVTNDLFTVHFTLSFVVWLHHVRSAVMWHFSVSSVIGEIICGAMYCEWCFELEQRKQNYCSLLPLLKIIYLLFCAALCQLCFFHDEFPWLLHIGIAHRESAECAIVIAILSVVRLSECLSVTPVSYTHLTLPTNREV